MKKYTYKSGEWNVICHVCGFRFPASKIKKRWDGVLTCSKCWEPRHPQDLIRIPVDDMSIPFTSPEQVSYIGVCSINGQTDMSDYAESDCARLGNTFLVNYSIPQSTFGPP